MPTNLEKIIATGLLFAFLLPAMGYVAATLPNPVTPSGTLNYTANFTYTGAYLLYQLNYTFGNLTTSFIGSNCVGPGTSAQTCNTQNSSVSANPTIFQAYAFIVKGLGILMTTIVQLPWLDYISLNFLVYGLSTAVPFLPFGFIQAGGYLIYIYMGIVLVVQGISYIGKYNLLSAE